MAAYTDLTSLMTDDDIELYLGSSNADVMEAIMEDSEQGDSPDPKYDGRRKIQNNSQTAAS